MKFISWIFVFDVWLSGEQEEGDFHSQHTGIDTQIAYGEAI